MREPLGRREFPRKTMQTAAAGAVFAGSALSASAAEAKEENNNRATVTLSRVIGLAVFSAWFLFAIGVTGNAAEVRSSGNVGGGANEIIAPGWERSYKAGYTDSNGHYAGGSEILHLVSHKGKLFAAASYWMDPRNIYYGGTDSSTGWGQILRLDKPGGQWQVDLEMGPPHVRPEIIKSITFTTDGKGRLLAAPVNLLLVSTFSPKQTTADITVFTRDDKTGEWGRSTVASFPKPGFMENLSVRAIHVHRDKVTGIDRVFMSIGVLGVFSGVYDPAAPGSIRWKPESESGPVKTRPLAIIEANGSLLFSAGAIIYRRNDGESPTYTIIQDVGEISKEQVASPVGGVRGMSAIPNPKGQGESILFVWAPGGPTSGSVYRLDPDGKGGYTRTEEIRLARLITEYLGGTPVGAVLAGYNNVYPVLDPSTGETVHLLGCECFIAGHEFPQTTLSAYGGCYAGAIYAIRDKRGNYRLNEVNGPIAPGKPLLAAVRTCVLSPFEEENSSVLYFGGNDCNWAQLSPNWAWVFKATVENALRKDAPRPQRMDEAQVKAVVSGLHYPFEHKAKPAFTVQIPSLYKETPPSQAEEVFHARMLFSSLSISVSTLVGQPKLGEAAERYLADLKASGNGRSTLEKVTETQLPDGTPALEFVIRWVSKAGVTRTSQGQIVFKDGYSILAATHTDEGGNQQEKFFRSLRFESVERKTP